MRVRRPVSGPRVASVLALLLVAACADGGGAVRADLGPCPSPGADAPSLPAPDVSDTAQTADAFAAADGADAADDGWALPACETACDRVVDCAVFACEGFEWTTAGQLAAGCHDVCDAAFAASVAEAGGCDDVLAGPGAAIATLAALCDENPCELVCGRLAECVVTECPAIGEAAEGPIRDDCVRTCDPDDLAWVTSFATCADLVTTVSASDPAFREACEGVPTECADVADCAPYGARIAECLAVNCGDTAAPYEDGLRWAFTEFCRTAEPCASARDVGAVIDPALTCADPPLADIGGHPPFVSLCAGTNGVDPAALRAACEDVLACAGAGWLPDADACMALIVLRDDAAAATRCLGAAAGCGEVFACLEDGEGG